MNLLPKLTGPITLTGELSTASKPVHVRDEQLPAEGYRLTVESDCATLSAADDAGFVYGEKTWESLRKAGPVACGIYEDAPVYRYRCFQLDVSRHFFSLEEVKKLLEECANLKLNVFQWHLSDDQGYRIESKVYPKLNEVASWRDEDGVKVGGYYTQDEIRELVAFAAARHITVVPVVDLPGHTSAIIAAYPELSCSGEPCRVETGAGIYTRILCGGNEDVYRFLEPLLMEVCDLFPGPWFHIGGDEAVKDEWKKCPKCQAAIVKFGLKDEEELQAHFTARLADLLETRGKTVIGANEILASGKMKLNVVAQYWNDMGAEYSAREIPKGRRFIFSNVNSFYLDYDPSVVTLKGTYLYQPNIPGGEQIAPEQILGLVAPLWTEYVYTNEQLEAMAFPRVAALAENAWCGGRNLDWEDFAARLRIYAQHWDELGIAYGDLNKAMNPTIPEAAQALLKLFLRWGDAEDHDNGEVMREKLKETINGISSQPFFDLQALRILLSPAYSDDDVAAVYKELAALLL